MRIILALFIYIYAFGIDVCKEKEIEMSIYINKYTNAYENKNLGYSEEKLYKKLHKYMFHFYKYPLKI